MNKKNEQEWSLVPWMFDLFSYNSMEISAFWVYIQAPYDHVLREADLNKLHLMKVLIFSYILIPASSSSSDFFCVKREKQRLALCNCFDMRKFGSWRMFLKVKLKALPPAQLSLHHSSHVQSPSHLTLHRPITQNAPSPGDSSLLRLRVKDPPFSSREPQPQTLILVISHFLFSFCQFPLGRNVFRQEHPAAVKLPSVRLPHHLKIIQILTHPVYFGSL